MTQEKIQLLEPTGKYCMGMSTYFLKDKAPGYNYEQSRPLSVHIYYPCIKSRNEYPPYLKEEPCGSSMLWIKCRKIIVLKYKRFALYHILK